MIDTMFHNAVSVLSNDWLWYSVALYLLVILPVTRAVDALEGIHHELRRLRQQKRSDREV